MLSAHCPRHGRTVLVPTSRIEGIAADAAGHVVRWRCSCGAHQTTRVERRLPAL
jgi:hypothetical protein